MLHQGNFLQVYDNLFISVALNLSRGNKFYCEHKKDVY